MRVCMGVLLGAYFAIAGTAVAEDDLRTFKENLIETYHHKEPAFSIAIPYEWPELPEGDGASLSLIEYQVLGVRDRDYRSYLSVLVMDRPPELQLADSARAVAEQDGRKVFESRLDHLADGTEINVGKVHDAYPLGPGIPLNSIFLSAFQNDKWILVIATEVGDQANVANKLKEIAYSIRFE